VKSDTREVPLYLIPQIVAAEVNQYGRAIKEIHVVLATGHQYSIKTLIDPEVEGDE